MDYPPDEYISSPDPELELPQYANTSQHASPPPTYPPFYVGSSSGEQTCDQFLTDFELNSNGHGYSEAHFSGGGLYEN